ncbi:MAG: mechanosensitive ion channel family protein [Saprospiraceae bacterium]
MNPGNFFSETFFQWEGLVMTYSNIMLSALVIMLFVFTYKPYLKLVRKGFLDRLKLEEATAQKVANRIRLGHFFAFLAILSFVLLYNSDLSTFIHTNIGPLQIFASLMGIQLARILDLVVVNYLLKPIPEESSYQTKFSDAQGGQRTVQYVIYVLLLWLLVENLHLNFTLFRIPLKDTAIDFQLTNLIQLSLIILTAKAIYVILAHFFLQQYFNQNKVNIGSQYAIKQLVKYVIYTVAAIFGMGQLGIDLTLFWGGAAALLLGVGIGLQQTFNDFFSGILLLTERPVEVGDILAIDGFTGKVKQIGLRTSKIETLENIVMIVPNSKIVGNNIVNWSYNDNKARFFVGVGVAYGSDTQLVKTLLLNIAAAHKRLLKKPAPFVRLAAFGASSLDFELHFYSSDFIAIENIKSELRFEIDQVFRTNNISIPFPQQDIWIKGGLK